MTIHDEFSGTLTLTENSSRELFRVLQEQDEAFISDVLDGKCGFTLKSADGRSVELVPKADRKTEPIPHDDYIETENDHLEARCLNCNNAKACKEKHWEGCVYEPKDEKTCETCKYWKYIAREWQCETTKCQGYTPKDEPQTDCAWK